MENLTDNFKHQRLQNLAYKIIGSVSDAEDIVQDAWLRWRAADHSSVKHPESFITKIVTNLSLDRLRSNQKLRETYTGSWLPEPSVESFPADDSSNPEYAQQLMDDISIAFLLAREKLSTNERVAFTLHDVFSYDFAEVAEIMEREPTSCRQLASRARKALKKGPKRYIADGRTGKKLATAFQRAIVEGDVQQLTKLLSSGSTFISDGGGKVSAVPAPVIGGEKIAKMLLGFAKAYRIKEDFTSHYARINGLPGFVLCENERPVQTFS